MTRVLVSGGTGYAGRFIVEHLLASGYKVTVGGRTAPAPGFFSKDVAFVPLLLDPDADQVEAFDHVYYFVHAAFDHLPGKYRGGEGDDPEGFRRANLEGSVRLFETAREAGIRRCVFLSSRAVYGTQAPGSLLVEDMAAKPDTLYGDVKLQAERSLLSLCGHGFVTASLRTTGIYGPAGPGRTHKWASLFEDYVSGRIVPPRIGTEVHGEDVAKAVRLMLETDAVRINGETFNVSDILTGSREILSILQRVTHCPHPLPEQADASGYNPMGCCKIQSLGWRPGGRNLLRRTIEQLTGSSVAAPATSPQSPLPFEIDDDDPGGEPKQMGAIEQPSPAKR